MDTKTGFLYAKKSTKSKQFLKIISGKYWSISFYYLKFETTYTIWNNFVFEIRWCINLQYLLNFLRTVTLVLFTCFSESIRYERGEIDRILDDSCTICHDTVSESQKLVRKWKIYFFIHTTCDILYVIYPYHTKWNCVCSGRVRVAT